MPGPGGPKMPQRACNLTDAFDGFLRAPVRYALLDRDTKFTAEFQAILTAAEVERDSTAAFLLHYHGERAHQGLDHPILQLWPARRLASSPSVNDRAGFSSNTIAKQPE
jgi:hypothetical protein